MCFLKLTCEIMIGFFVWFHQFMVRFYCGRNIACPLVLIYNFMKSVNVVLFSWLRHCMLLLYHKKNFECVSIFYFCHFDTLMGYV